MYRHALIVIAGLGVAALAACSDTQTSSSNDGATMSESGQKTMGDEGKLPTTKTMGSQVPTMGTAEPAQDPVKRMGDEGKLPATNTMSGAVPEMNKGDAK